MANIIAIGSQLGELLALALQNLQQNQYWYSYTS